MLLLREGDVIEIEENGLMLGAFEFSSYSTATRRLQTGDRLLLYTDGIIEAANSAGEFYGQTALREVLARSAGCAADEAADRILSSVQKWSSVQNDDLTLIVCDYRIRKRCPTPQ